MSIVRTEHRVDVTSALPAAVRGRGPVDIAVTVVADPARVSPSPDVVVAIPGGTYHRRYWDLQPPGRLGYSKAAWLAARGVVVVATDYLGGGDSTRPDDGDFMTLEVAADAGHAVLEDVRSRASTGTLVDGLPAVESPRYGAERIGRGTRPVSEATKQAQRRCFGEERAETKTCAQPELTYPLKSSPVSGNRSAVTSR